MRSAIVICIMLLGAVTATSIDDMPLGPEWKKDENGRMFTKDITLKVNRYSDKYTANAVNSIDMALPNNVVKVWHTDNTKMIGFGFDDIIRTEVHSTNGNKSRVISTISKSGSAYFDLDGDGIYDVWLEPINGILADRVMRIMLEYKWVKVSENAQRISIDGLYELTVDGNKHIFKEHKWRPKQH